MSEGFGCDACWPASAEAAWDARARLTSTAELVDESHFHVMILSCPACSQAFISVFTETIDWVDGEDPQSWTVLPLTREELSALSHPERPFDEAGLQALGMGRRSLRRDCPKGQPPGIHWSTGIPVGLHD